MANDHIAIVSFAKVLCIWVTVLNGDVMFSSVILSRRVIVQGRRGKEVGGASSSTSTWLSESTSGRH